METVEGDRLSFSVRGLLPEMTYYFKLQAKNLKGFGPFTPVTSFITPETLVVPSLSNQNMNFSKDSDSTFYQQILQILRY
jgi:hypothetical protein